MSDSEPDEAAEGKLTPDMWKLINLLMELDRGLITEMQRAHGGVVRTFLRDCSVDYPEVAAALVSVAPSGEPKERSDALYAALDHIVNNPR